MDGDPEGLYVVTPVCPAGEVGQIELNLIPSLIQPHRHGADEGFHTGGGLVVGRPEPSPNVFVIQDLNLEGEVLLELHERVGTFLMIMTRKGSLMPRVSC